MLAGSLVFIEFLAGMQRYLSQTVLPLVAADLNGVRWYGPLSAASQAPMFLMMPTGAWLLSRFRVGRLMIFFPVAPLPVAAVMIARLAAPPGTWIRGTGDPYGATTLTATSMSVSRSVTSA